MSEKTSLLAGASAYAMSARPIGGFHPLVRGPQIAYAPDDAAAAGPLSFEQAVQSLIPADAAKEPEEAVAAPGGAVDEPDEIEGAASAPEDAAAEEAEALADAEPEAEAEEPAVEPLEPPKYWSKDAKDRFAELPPELQAVVLEQEGPREAAAAKAKADAAAISQRAEAEMGQVQKLAEVLAERVPQWVQSFNDRWANGDPDWVAYAQEHGVEMMTLAKTQFEQEARQLAEADQARQAAQDQAFQAYVKAEFAKLGEIAPDLADPEKGPERRAAVAQYLAQAGIPQEALKNISAVEMTMAHKAMLWDQAQGRLKTAPKPKNPAPKAAPVRPGAAQAQSPTQRTRAAAVGRFHAKPTIENAVALLTSGT